MHQRRMCKIVFLLIMILTLIWGLWGTFFFPLIFFTDYVYVLINAFISMFYRLRDDNTKMAYLTFRSERECDAAYAFREYSFSFHH